MLQHVIQAPTLGVKVPPINRPPQPLLLLAIESQGGGDCQGEKEEVLHDGCLGN